MASTPMKPWGIFSTAHGVPDGASFGVISCVASDDAMREAARLAARPFRPFAWVLSLMGWDATTPLERAWVEQGVRDRFAAFGVPITAIFYGEEWYGTQRHRFAGADAMAQIRAACAWVGEQQATIKAVWPTVPIVGIAHHFCDVPIFGPDYYAPVPAHTDILAVEAYVPAGQTWDAMVLDGKLAYATGTPYTWYDPETRRVTTSRRTEPVVIIAQGFRADGDPLWHAWPSLDVSARVAPWVRHDRVIAVWPFDWTTEYGITGWRDWPDASLHALAWGIG